MKQITILVSIMSLLFGCNHEEVRCPNEYIEHNNYTSSCMAEYDENTVDNYNEESIVKIIEALKKACTDLDLQFEEKLWNTKIILTDNKNYYNEQYWFYVTGRYIPEDKNSEEYNLFDRSAGFYRVETNTIFVNLTKKDTEKPNNILIHEMTHVIEKINTGYFQYEHEDELYWHELKLTTLQYL